jgi:CheY-like chemotaxis protein
MSTPQPVNILLVDDRPENLLALCAELEPLGENLIEVNSGREALRALLKQEIAVILLDLKMPEMHGFDVIPLLRRGLPEIRIITTTLLSLEVFEQSGEIYRQANATAGADAFIPKHNLTTDLIPTILELVHSAIGPAVKMPSVT